MAKVGGFQFAIDRGGTFTDVFARCPSGKVRVLKLLSVDPKNYRDAPTEGIRRVLEDETGKAMPRDQKIDASCIEWIRMGTTVATNALLERRGERMALLVSKGLKDVIFIGNQARPKLFDLEIVVPGVLYEEVIEVTGRVLVGQAGCGLDKAGMRKVRGATNEDLYVEEELDEEKLRRDLGGVLSKGIRSLAVALTHSYAFREHEDRVEAVALEMGFEHVSPSWRVMPMVRLVPRGFTACVDAYLTPCIRRYLEDFRSGFSDGLAEGGGVNVSFMRSDGGLAPMSSFCGSRAILSGPAGGVVGYARTAFGGTPVIGFDMGGTSTDVSRFGGAFEHVFETTTAGVTVQAPQLDISTVAAGGGSRLFFRSGLFVVGPESAGAHPGPVCYRKGGHLTVTDANLVLGRLLPSYFPRIFGPGEDQPVDAEGARAEFEKLAQTVNGFMKSEMTVREVAMGFVRVANESMCRPIRNLTVGKGRDARKHALACFGGAGGQHACAIARSLGMSRVYVHRYAGILSAYGLALADVVHEEQAPCAERYAEENLPRFRAALSRLRDDAVAALKGQGFSEGRIETEDFLHMRYKGTDCALMCSVGGGGGGGGRSFLEEFFDRYRSEFGFLLRDRAVIVDDVRVRATGKSGVGMEEDVDAVGREDLGAPKEREVTQAFFEEGLLDTKVFLMEDLKPGHRLPGPCIVVEKLSAILVEPGCCGSVTAGGNLAIDVGLGGSGTEAAPKKGLDTVQLSVFSHRFMSIAEQMGRILQRTSISTNIKERLDFSCALFGPDGGLISNAPHIPVHLGAMQTAVRFQIEHLGGDLRDGDVILSNHPKAGGSHLPDLTVITPVFCGGGPAFFVANRGHHADIGGVSPGSMPPHSRRLFEEGAAFKSFKLVEGGAFREAALTEALLVEPAKHPGCSGTRCLQDNLSDLKAQVAANNRGIGLVSDLIGEYGLEVVQRYMGHIQENAEVAVREMLKGFGSRVLKAEDFMDDGSRIALEVTIDGGSGSARFDFAGTSPQVWGNLNAPRAVTLSAVIYCLRCLVGRDIPLNQGCLNPVEVAVPEGSLLDPSEDAAVVGGNVLTSQRTVDVVLRAFGSCAASQGCCNNVTFGDGDFGYYETVAGGSGAGPGWHGRSGVHVHMTNTRMTDPEIVERRFPVLVDRFALAEGTGGEGRFRGGDGVERHLRFRKPLRLSVLTERRVVAPYGLRGGGDGARGLNLLSRSGGGGVVNIGAKCAVDVLPGDVFMMRTPGGGGWGSPDGDDVEK